MVDTQRSQSTLLTGLFQDGQTGGISAQDIRDFVVSVTPPYGGMYVSTPAIRAIASAGVYVKASGTTTATGLSAQLDMPTDNRLRYTGTPTRHFQVTCQASISFAAGTNQVAGVQLWHYDDSAASGALIAHSEAQCIADGTSVVQITTSADVALDTNDYLEIHIANHTGTNNMTLDLGYLFAMGMLV